MPLGDDPKTRQVLTFLLDVTDRRATEIQLQQATKMEAVGHLTGGVAHDFNNILTALMGNLELLADRIEGDDKANKFLEICRRAARRGGDLTQRLLAFSRRQVLRPEPTNINLLVHGMAELLQRTLGEDIEIRTILDPDVAEIEVDRSQLESALLNLAINSRDAMPYGGKLTIETTNFHLDQTYSAANPEVRPGDYVRVAVSDTGTGIPAKILDHVFEPFYTTKDIGKGSGLGLSMAFGFVKQSEGHINIYSEVDHGTSVRLYLPQTSTQARNDEGKADVAAAETPRGTESILVVEDDADVRGFAVTILEHLGYSVAAAADGPAALALLDELRPIDLLLTDVILPQGMGGNDVAREIRMRRPGIKVLFVSGYTENGIVHHGRLDNGVELLSKPFTVEQLAQKIREVLDG